MLEISTHNHTHPTMSPTHFTISGVVARTRGRNDSTAVSNPSSNFSMIPRAVNFWKYHIPISLPKLQPVSDTARWKKYVFYQLMSTIYGLLKLHSVADLVPLIVHKVPTKKFTAQREATKFMHKV